SGAAAVSPRARGMEPVPGARGPLGAGIALARGAGAGAAGSVLAGAGRPDRRQPGATGSLSVLPAGAVPRGGPDPRGPHPRSRLDAFAGRHGAARPDAGRRDGAVRRGALAPDGALARPLPGRPASREEAQETTRTPCAAAARAGSAVA